MCNTENPARVNPDLYIKYAHHYEMALITVFMSIKKFSVTLLARRPEFTGQNYSI